MNAVNRIMNSSNIISFLFFFILVVNYGNAQIDVENRSKLIKPEVEITSDLFWHVKAYHPEAKLLPVKAIDKDGTLYDVRAIQTSESTSVLDVKALVDGKRLPIKVLPLGDSPFYPLKAIREDGSLVNIKAMNQDGKILDIKGVRRSGNIIDLSAITSDSMAFNIIAISPLGEVNTVKGVKMLTAEEEAVIHGISIFAHVKAIKQN